MKVERYKRSWAAGALLLVSFLSGLAMLMALCEHPRVAAFLSAGAFLVSCLAIWELDRHA